MPRLNIAYQRYPHQHRFRWWRSRTGVHKLFWTDVICVCGRIFGPKNSTAHVIIGYIRAVTNINKYFSEGTDVGLYPHMPILRNGTSLAWSLHRRISMLMFTSGWAWPARWSIRPILGFWGPKFTNYLLPWTPINHRAKCDAASIIIGGEIRNRTNKHTDKQTNDISTPCLSACVGNNVERFFYNWYSWKCFY